MRMLQIRKAIKWQVGGNAVKGVKTELQQAMEGRVNRLDGLKRTAVWSEAWMRRHYIICQVLVVVFFWRGVLWNAISLDHGLITLIAKERDGRVYCLQTSRFPPSMEDKKRSRSVCT